MQIEQVENVNIIDEISSLEGRDAAFIRPYDLSASMGITTQFQHPYYCRAIDKINRKYEEYNIIPGVNAVQPNPEEVKKCQIPD